jgi:hypothetical protein
MKVDYRSDGVLRDDASVGGLKLLVMDFDRRIYWNNTISREEKERNQNI